jgi:cyanophycin synthetase
MTFKPDIDSNPGRFNVFDLGEFKVMLDYGHNAAGYNAVIQSAKKMKARRLVGVVGVPGDRLDKNIAEVGEICGREFDRLYIKEDTDLRGRKPGEVADILYTSAVRGGIKKEAAKIILPELKALESAILDAQQGDMIIMLYEEFEPAVELINKYRQELKESMVSNQILVKDTVG